MRSNLLDRLKLIAEQFSPVTLASSLSIEDMVLTDAIARHALPISIFVLDTGRLHADTLALIERVKMVYRLELNVIQPNPESVAAYVTQHGRDAFYANAELRKRCCAIRKVEPLQRALAGQRAWITGQRRDASVTRSHLELEEWDSGNGLHKFNPLCDWSEADVWSYIRAHGVPYNRLYDQGYRSIGCAPCTRPVLPLEDMRAGRWWWEQPEGKECGLHVTADGKLARKVPA